MKNILIFTETIAGNGHYFAAQSIKKALLQMEPTANIKLVNGLSVVSQRLEKAIRHTYLQTLRYAPALWGKAYAQETWLRSLFQAPLGRMIAGFLRDEVMRAKPDVVVCTHAFCLSAIAYLKEYYDFRLGAAITDFDVNSFWIHNEVDFYLVSHEHLKQKMFKMMGGEAANIVPTGIPIDPQYADVSRIPKARIREQLGLLQRPTLLMLGGGLGLGPMERLMRNITEAYGESLQLIVGTGRNTILRDKCDAVYGHHPHVRVLGYVDGLAQYMAVADLIVTKPGGLTSSEALALGVPILITKPIPGQEERNSRFLMEQQVALRIDRLRDLIQYVHPFIEDEQFYEQFASRARHLGKPDSAKRAAKIILDLNP